MPDLVLRRAWVRTDQRSCRDDLSGRAEPALDGVGANERRDQRVVAETFDRRHLAIADGVHERDTRQRRDTVELDGARTAMSLAAGDLRTRESEVFTQDLREGAADRRVNRILVAVDTELRQGWSPPRCRRGGSA